MSCGADDRAGVLEWLTVSKTFHRSSRGVHSEGAVSTSHYLARQWKSNNTAVSAQSNGITLCLKLSGVCIIISGEDDSSEARRISE